jgi:hypothetical protein
MKSTNMEIISAFDVYTQKYLPGNKHFFGSATNFVYNKTHSKAKHWSFTVSRLADQI